MALWIAEEHAGGRPTYNPVTVLVAADNRDAAREVAEATIAEARAESTPQRAQRLDAIAVAEIRELPQGGYVHFPS